MASFRSVAIFLVSLCIGVSDAYISRCFSKSGSSTSLFSSNERSEPRKWEVKNKETSPQGGGGEKDWKSGYVFNKHTQKKRRNDPWWMREEESNNPRILPAYKPWWVTENVIVDDTWKVAELRAEATKRGKSLPVLILEAVHFCGLILFGRVAIDFSSQIPPYIQQYPCNLAFIFSHMMATSGAAVLSYCSVL